MSNLESDITSLAAPSKDYSRVLVHEASKISPPLDGDRMEALLEMLVDFELDALEPVWAVRVPESDGHYNGTVGVISGRTTLEACRRLGRQAIVRVYEGPGSPTELAASLNLLRPNHSVSQRAAVGVLVSDRAAEEGQRRQKTAGGDQKSLLSKLSKAIPGPKEAPGGTSDTALQLPFDRYKYAGRIVDASRSSIIQAKAIRDGDPSLFTKILHAELMPDGKNRWDLQSARSEIRNARKREHLKAAAANTLPSHITPGSTIITGNSLLILPTLKRHKYRLICTDPKYNQGIDYGNGSKADKLSEDVYLAECRQWMTECAELLTPDGSFVLIISDRYAADFVNICKRELNLHLRNWIIWHEAFGVHQSNNFSLDHRHILYFVVDPKNYVFNEEAFNRPSQREETYGDKRAKAGGKLWGNVWGGEPCLKCHAPPPINIPRLQGTSTERMPDFPTQLPLSLIRPIVEGLTEPGDQVLDPFSGSGTTPAACALTDRSYTAIEISPTFAEASRARLAAIHQQMAKPKKRPA